jgi:hypothetical protein
LPPVQAFPHAPQFAELVARFTHEPAHAVSSAAQVPRQAPPLQTSSGAHVTPQPPQLCGSASRSAHAPPHEVVPRGHWHAPATHVVPHGHAPAQVPQCAVSVIRFAQSPLHAVSPGAHDAAQAPLSHTSALVHA